VRVLFGTAVNCAAEHSKLSLNGLQRAALDSQTRARSIAMRNLAIFATILASAFCVGSATAAQSGTRLGHTQHARIERIKLNLTALSHYPRLTEAEVAAAAQYRSAYDAHVPLWMKTFQARQ
jgi:hypothetical protein